jgi:hypothetical protein
MWEELTDLILDLAAEVRELRLGADLGPVREQIRAILSQIEEELGGRP